MTTLRWWMRVVGAFYEVTGRAIWMIIHSAIIVTGLLTLRRARSEG